jgi:hypothetical protein
LATFWAIFWATVWAIFSPQTHPATLIDYLQQKMVSFVFCWRSRQKDWSGPIFLSLFPAKTFRSQSWRKRWTQLHTETKAIKPCPFFSLWRLSNRPA